jgi:hypothetical protein
MGLHVEGERLIVAATLDPVATGQEFDKIPPHMTVLRWFQMGERHRQRFFEPAMENIFNEQDVFQNLVGTRRKNYGEQGQFPVREIKGAETGPWYGLHSLVMGLGNFREGDVFAHNFAPHITMERTRKVQRGERLAIPTVALISAHSGETTQRVLASYALGSKDNG